MEYYKDYDLWGVSTMRTHSIARDYFIPSSIPELIDLVNSFYKEGKKFYVISGGSNVVFDDVVETPIISLLKVDNHIETKNSVTDVGCSVRTQKLLNHLKENGLGGGEYLFSLPACIGGCIYMNAGRGRKYNQSISDYLESVLAFSMPDNSIKRFFYSRKDFQYRTSPFQKNDCIILSARFKFPEQDSNITQLKIQERLEISKKYLSADKPSCGSVYRIGNKIIFRLLKGMKVGDACFSKKTPNWITNNGNAKGSDVIKLINKGIKVHHLFFQECVPEIQIVK